MKRLLGILLCGAALSAIGEETSDVDYGQATGSPSLDLIWQFEYAVYEDQTCAIVTGVRNSGGATVTGDISVPETVVVGGDSPKSYLVKAIAADAFKNQLGISSITISRYVEDVGTPFCSGCSALTSISVDADSNWFSDRNGMLFDIDGEELIACPPGLSSIQLPTTTTTIDDYAFRGCYRMKTIEIPAGVKSIGDQAFANCKKLESVTFCGNAPSVGSDLFSGSTPDITVYVPEGNTSFGPVPGTWQGENLEYSSGGTVSGVVTATSGNIVWCYHVVNGKAELYNNGLSCIGTGVSQTFTLDSETFQWVGDGCLNIPESLGGYGVTGIGSNAFLNCSALTTVSIPATVTKIDDGAFANCTGISSLTLPTGVKRLGSHPFAGSSISSIAIPESINNIDGNPMSGCDSMLTVTIDANNSYYAVSDGILYDKDVKILVGCPARKEGATIAASCTEIGPEAFLGCFRISSLSIPESVTAIDASAFADMPRLTSLVIPASVTKIEGEALFGDSAAITAIEFTGDAPSVDADIFLGTDTNLVIKVTEGTTGWDGDPESTALPAGGKWPTDGINGRAIRFKDAEESESSDDPVGRQTYTDGNGNTWLYTVENGKAQLGYWGSTPVLENTAATGTVTVPETLGGYPLSTIPDRAFENCSGITCIEIPSSINAIGDGVFNGCTSLEEIKVDSDSTKFRSKYCALYSKDGKTLVKVPAKFDFDWSLTTTVTGTEKLLQVTDLYTATNVLSVGEQTTDSIVSNNYASVTQDMLFNGVTTIADYAFTDCGKTAATSVTNKTTAVEILSIEAVLISQYETGFNITVIEGSASYEFVECLIIPSTVTSVGEYATEGSHFSCVEWSDVVTSLGNIASTLGLPSSGIDDVINTEAELAEFNEFLHEAGVTGSTSLTDSQKSNLLASYEVSAATPTAVLLEEEPVITLDQFKQNSSSHAGNMDLVISLKTASGTGITMAKEKIRNMIRVGASLSTMTSSPKILASPDADGSTVYFTVTAPDDLSGSSSLFYSVNISR